MRTAAQKAATKRWFTAGQAARRKPQLHNTYCPECGDKVYRNASHRCIVARRVLEKSLPRLHFPLDKRTVTL